MEDNKMNDARIDEGNPEENRNNDHPNDHRVDILSYLQDVAYALAVILVLFLLVFRIVIVIGPSMNRTLFAEDYVILINNTFYRQKKQGDIVVIRKDSFRDGEPIIKRIIATEGQEVDIDFTAGIVYVDGQALDEPYTNSATNLFEGVEFPLTVKEGCVFVLGDNRNNSQDSRSEEIGLIDTRQILGRAVFLLFPGPDPETDTRDFRRIGVLS